MSGNEIKGTPFREVGGLGVTNARYEDRALEKNLDVEIAPKGLTKGREGREVLTKGEWSEEKGREGESTFCEEEAMADPAPKDLPGEEWFEEQVEVWKYLTEEMPEKP